MPPLTSSPPLLSRLYLSVLCNKIIKEDSALHCGRQRSPQTLGTRIPPQERRRSGRGWSGDARTEAELQAATDAMHIAWQRLRMDTRDAQLRRAVRKVCNWLKRVRGAAVVRFFERHVVELEKQLRMGDQHRFFQNIKSVQLEETKKVESQCVRDEGGRVLRDKGRIRERWVRFFRSLLNSKSDMLDPDIPKRLPQQPVASALGIEPSGSSPRRRRLPQR